MGFPDCFGCTCGSSNLGLESSAQFERIKLWYSILVCRLPLLWAKCRCDTLEADTFLESSPSSSNWYQLRWLRPVLIALFGYRKYWWKEQSGNVWRLNEKHKQNWVLDMVYMICKLIVHTRLASKQTRSLFPKMKQQRPSLRQTWLVWIHRLQKWCTILLVKTSTPSSRNPVKIVPV